MKSNENNKGDNPKKLSPFSISKYEGIFKCAWCGEHSLSDSEVKNRILNDTLGRCPNCNRFSWANGIRAKFKADWKDWKGVYGTAKEI